MPSWPAHGAANWDALLKAWLNTFANDDATLKTAAVTAALGGSQPSSAYRLTSDGTTVTAFDKTGTTVSVSTDGGAVLTAVLALLPATGGHIEFRNEGLVFPFSTTPAVPRSITRRLLIAGNGATVKLANASSPRFLDFNKMADNDVFQNVDIEDFVFDANSLGGKHHLIIGGWMNGSWLTKVSYDRVNVRRCKAINVVTGTDSNVDFRIIVALTSANDSGDSLQTITNCELEDLSADGGLAGYMICGIPTAGGSYSTANVYCDNNVVDRWRIVRSSAPTAAISGGCDILIGNKGYGGKCRIGAGYGYGSPDVGLEVDGHQDVEIDDNATFDDCWNAAVYHVNYRQPANPEAQLLRCVSATMRRSTLNDHGQGFVATCVFPRTVTGDNATDTFTSTAHGLANGDAVFFTALTGGTGLATCTQYFVIGAAANTFQLSITSGGSAVNFTTDVTAATLYLNKNRPGSVIFGEGALYHRLSTSAGFTTPANGIGGEAVDLFGCRLQSGKPKIIQEFPDYNSGSNATPSAILVRGTDLTNRCYVDLEPYVKATNNRTGTGTVDFRPLIVRNGNLSNARVRLATDVNFTNAGNANIIDADIGSVSPNPSELGGFRVSVVELDRGTRGNTPVGIQFESGAAGINAVSFGEILVFDSDFSGLASTSTDINFAGATTLRAKTRFRNVLWRAAVKAATTLADALASPTYSASITPDASASAWQVITVTNGTAFTINAPTNPPASTQTQPLTIEILNSSGGAMGVVTWNAAFVLVGGAFTNPASTKKRFVRFEWNGANWVETSRAGADY